jgi:hypothetical protein
MRKKTKPEGIEELVAPVEHPSIQEITMLDWYAGFAMLRAFGLKDTAKEMFDMAEEMLAERKKRL